MSDNSKAKAIASYNYKMQTVRITRDDKTRIYFMNSRMSVASFCRLWKLAYDSVPRHMLINESDGFMFFWYDKKTPLTLNFGYRSTHNDYWNVYYDIGRIIRSQPTKRLMKIAESEALKYYGWTEKDYHDAWLTAMEINANTQ